VPFVEIPSRAIEWLPFAAFAEAQATPETPASEAIRGFAGLKSGQGGVDHGRAEVGTVRRTY
jgi:hypothetical protein